MTVRRVEADHVLVVKPGHGRAAVRVSLRRLLAVRPDGQGCYYQFHGFAPRRYVTSAYVCSVGDAEALLCLPEWHPRRPVRLPARLLASESRHVGAWVRVRCDLSASSAGRLQLSDLLPGLAPDPGSMPPPDLVQGSEHATTSGERVLTVE